MEFVLRKAVRADAARIGELFVEMLRAVYKKDDVQGYAEGAIDYYFSGGEDWICVAEAGGEVEGFIAMEVHREEREYIYIDDFCVAGHCRGMGAGSKLLTAAEDYARELGIGAIALHVEKQNEPARAFYDRRGFYLFRDDGSRLCLIKDISEV